MIFTQYMRPSGTPRPNTIDMPADVEALAAELTTAGWAFEIEVLTTGEVSMDCCDQEGPLAMEIVQNGPAVLVAVAELTREAHRVWIERGRPDAVGHRRGAALPNAVVPDSRDEF